MASTIYDGKKLRFIFNEKLFLHATSCKLSIATKLEEIATKDTDGSMVVPGNYSWSGSTDALLANAPQGDTIHVTFDTLMIAKLSGQEIDVDFTTDVSGDIIYSGKCYIENAEITADTGVAVKVSISFKGNGDLTRAVVTP
jgi:hypothetical protein